MVWCIRKFEGFDRFSGLDGFHKFRGFDRLWISIDRFDALYHAMCSKDVNCCRCGNVIGHTSLYIKANVCFVCTHTKTCGLHGGLEHSWYC